MFIESYPLSKLDTQFSTRYAKEIACDFLEKDCGRYDFFYTIRSGSTIVGGPSAGAALTILTIAALDHEPLRQNVAMTGTITSGGLIGPVAGILPKALAANDAGMTVVVVPALASLALDEARRADPEADLANLTFNDTPEYDETIAERYSKGAFRIVRAADLYDALPYFIEKEYPRPERDVVVPQTYTTIMSSIADDLCHERDRLLAQTSETIAGNETLENSTVQAGRRIATAIEQGRHYAAASYCFGQNIQLRTLALREEDLAQEAKVLRRELRSLEQQLELENLTTIGDVETFAIVRERLLESQESLDEMGANLTAQGLAYAIERGRSAAIWSQFFAMESSAYTIDREHLKDACYAKLGQADERVTYVETYLPDSLTAKSRDALAQANEDARKGEYALCLFSSSKASAEANLLSSALAVTEPRITYLVDEKLRAAARVLGKEEAQGLFPIMGYSYYEYARSLALEDEYSALTFSESALELSELHLYFPKKESLLKTAIERFPTELFVIFTIGFFTGVLVLHLLLRKDRQEQLGRVPKQSPRPPARIVPLRSRK